MYFHGISKPKIVLTDSGFKPALLAIKEGDTVTFSSKTGEAFWPASNVHPTHSNFPALVKVYDHSSSGEIG